MRNDQLSTGQYVILYVSTAVSTFLSIAGSALIIVSVTYRGRQQLKENTLFQFLLGLSICDIAFSIVVFASGFLRPQEPGYPLAIGNQGTCVSSAFFNIFFSTGAAFYNCFLSIHFWRTVQTTRNNQQKSDKCFQVSCHSLAGIVSILLSIAGMILDGYAPHPFLDMCYLATDSGKRLGQLRMLIVGILTIIGIYCTISVVRTVRRSLDRSGRYMKSAMSRGFSSMKQDDVGAMESTNRAGLGWSISTRTMTLFNSVRGSLRSEIAGERLDISPIDPTPTATEPSTTNASNTYSAMSTNPQAATNDGASSIIAEKSYPLFTSDESSESTMALSNHQRNQFVQEGNLEATDSPKPCTNQGRLTMDKLPSFRRTNSNRSQKTAGTEINQRKEVAVQAVWYTVAYLNTILVPIIGIILLNVTDAQDNEAEPQYFFLQWCVIFFVPIQGALNFLVFIRPRYNGWKAHFIREQEFEAKHSLPTINDSSKQNNNQTSTKIPSMFTILKKAVLEDVPKKRKRRPMPISGASNISGITGSSLSGSTRRFSRVSFAMDSSHRYADADADADDGNGGGSENDAGGHVVEAATATTTSHSTGSIEQQPLPTTARVVSKPVWNAASTSTMGSGLSSSSLLVVEDTPVDRGSPTQNTTPCESVAGEQDDDNNDVSSKEHAATTAAAAVNDGQIPRSQSTPNSPMLMIQHAYL